MMMMMMMMRETVATKKKQKQNDDDANIDKNVRVALRLRICKTSLQLNSTTSWLAG